MLKPPLAARDVVARRRERSAARRDRPRELTRARREGHDRQRRQQQRRRVDEYALSPTADGEPLLPRLKFLNDDSRGRRTQQLYWTGLGPGFFLKSFEQRGGVG